MKSAASNRVPLAASTSPLSQIPLPRRKNSAKGDKGLDVDDTDGGSEYGHDPSAPRSQAKMSLLGSTAFCCASGQKEDDAKIVPAVRPPKKRPPNIPSKKDPGLDPSSPKSPLLAAGRSLLARGRKGKVSQETVEDIPSPASETISAKLIQEDVKSRPSIIDNKLRPADDRRKITPPSPQRRLPREPAIPRREDARRYTDAIRKYRKDTTNQLSADSIKKCNHDTSQQLLLDTSDSLLHNVYRKCDAKEDSSLPNVQMDGHFKNVLGVGMSMDTSDSLLHNVYRKCDAKEDSSLPNVQMDGHFKNVLGVGMSMDTSDSLLHNVYRKCDAKEDSSLHNVQGNGHFRNVLDAKDVKMVTKVVLNKDCGEILSRSHESEDFDCPCCDRTSLMMDEAGLSDIEVKMFTSCDVIASDEQFVREEDKKTTSSSSEIILQLEVQSLKQDLQAEKLKLKTQQDIAQRLEDELSVMQQLRQELDKEKELRKIAEDKLLELLDYERIQKKENEKHMESKSTQLDIVETVPENIVTEQKSPLLYEGRLRKYQTYIAKLENDNLMLVNELKKFKDLSPRSQEEQAKVLVEKLGQMERNNHQQQIQYESCLDEVANKLVQTLLAQKRLEEECKVLHLRVEQLEQENGTLMELIEDDTVEKVETSEIKKATTSTPTITNSEQPKPSRHLLTSSPLKKLPTSQRSSKSFDNRKESSTKTTNASLSKNAYSEPRSAVTSPVSPGPKLGCASKIPSFGTSKPLLLRKKSEIDMPLSKGRGPQREASSSEIVPNSKPSSAIPSSRSKLPSSAKATKGASAKRKRLSRNGSPSDKGVKDSKQRIKSNHIRWDPHKDSPDDIPPPYRSIDELSPIPAFPQPQHVWSFNCEVNTNLPVPEIKRKIADSIEAFSDKLCCSLDHSEGKQNLSTSDSSTTIEGANRTRDEGYSTMSSDLQPDSAADTTISEPDNSATYVITEKTDPCNSDDSVTECLDGSMCSSSDSGFGPLYQVATLKFPVDLPAEETNRTNNDLPKFESSSKKHGTVKSKDQIASVKPTVRNVSSADDQLQNSAHSENKSNTICDNFQCDSPNLNNSSSSQTASPTKSKRADFDTPLLPKSPNQNIPPVIDQSAMIEYWSFPKEILGLKNYRKTWHLGPTKSIYDDQIVFCTRHSYIDDNLFDEKVETAEKATLTEPEEELWREKALAPFIDESIWSLYSSEGDIQVKHFPLEPLMSEPSLEKLITNCSPCIIVTENIDSDHSDDDYKTSTNKTSNNSSFTNLNKLTGQNSERFRPGLERVASDTVLYLKDAIHELEDSMRKGLKSSKNIPALHQNSGSESENSPSRELSLKPEILQTLEAALRKQSPLAWNSPSRSSSLSSLQSSTSCHVISDEMEDVDMSHASRKGSQDPDLSSASDAEYENLEHKDFVERWLQKEVACNNVPKMVPQLETVAELGEFSSPSVRRKTSLPCDTPDRQMPILPRMRFKSYPTDCNTPSPILTSPHSSPESKPLETFTSDEAYEAEDADQESLDPEAKEFNGEFYTLCSIGSNKSLDHFSPSKTRDMTLKQLVESPVFNRKSPPKNVSIAVPTVSDKLKPTGLVKPTRPLTLAVPSAPSVPGHRRQKSKSDVPSPSDTSAQKPNRISKAIPKVAKSADALVKTNICSKVPLKNLSVFQNGASYSSGEKSAIAKSPQSSLPTSATAASDVAVKAKSPTKIIFRTGSPSKHDDPAKKNQSKRERVVARQNRLKEGCGTAWVHLHADPSLSDPSVRNNLLDSIKAPSSSSGSSTEDEEEAGNEVLVIQTNTHLHKICKERRHKTKASANNPLYDLRKRSSIMGRRELFYRFGDKEKEAIACFDFLEEIPSASAESLNKRLHTHPCQYQPYMSVPPSNLSLFKATSSNKERISLQSPTGDISRQASINDPSPKMQAVLAKLSFPGRQLRLPNLWNQPLSHNMSSSTLNSQDFELLDHISLSDSCAESYSSTPDSYDDAS